MRWRRSMSVRRSFQCSWSLTPISGYRKPNWAAALGIERARLVRLLHRLVGRSLIRRLKSTADGRRHALRLTRKGRTVLVRAKALAAQHERRLIEKLGPERHRRLLKLLCDL